MAEACALCSVEECGTVASVRYRNGGQRLRRVASGAILCERAAERWLDHRGSKGDGTGTPWTATTMHGARKKRVPSVQKMGGVGKKRSVPSVIH